MEMKELLKEFMMVPAPSGYEALMAEKLIAYFKKYCDSVEMDRSGNVIGKIEGKHPEYPALMVFGHMDSIGMIVRKVLSDGFIKVDRLGGLPEKVLPGTEFIVRSEDGKWYPAILGPKSHHITPASEKYVVDTIDKLALDIGCVSKEEVNAMGIYTGCPAVYKPRVNELANGRISGTFIDNRGACAAIVRIAELLHENRPDCTVYIVGTVQEEYNLRGAMMAARTVKPDIAIGIDVTLAGDTPDMDHYFDNTVGAGPGVQLYTFHGRGTLNGNLAHEPLFKLICRKAEDENIRIQRTTGLGMLTDASYLQLEGMGVACMDVGFATRYTHTPVETCDPDDIEELSQLVSSVAQSIDDYFHIGRLTPDMKS